MFFVSYAQEKKASKGKQKYAQLLSFPAHRTLKAY